MKAHLAYAGWAFWCRKTAGRTSFAPVYAGARAAVYGSPQRATSAVPNRLTYLLVHKSVVCFNEVLWNVLPTGQQPSDAPFNMAVHLHQLGVPTQLISRVGDAEPCALPAPPGPRVLVATAPGATPAFSAADVTALLGGPPHQV